MRDTITTGLELLGMVLLVAAAAVFVGSLVGLPAGLAVGGIGLIGESAVVELRRRPAAPDREDAYL